MSDSPPRVRPHYDRTERTLGWLVMIFYVAQNALVVRLPRVEKTSLLREELRSWHYLIGLLLFVLLLARLLRWLRTPPVAPAPGMRPAGHGWARQLALTTYAVLAVMPVLGITQAWTEGLTVRLGPFVTLPAVIAENHVGWMVAGYFHSAFGFAVMFLTIAAMISAAWFWLRRGVGLLAAFPPGFGPQCWAIFAVTIYAFTTFESPEPGIPAVLGWVGLTAVIWGIGAALARRRAGAPGQVAHVRPPAPARAAAIVGGLALVALGAYGPYALFRVTPWPMGEVVRAPAGVTSHPAPVTTVTVNPPDAFEAQVAAETYKWCRFCHTVEAGGKHLAGPNLYAIFGQQAGTVPNFYYSGALVEAGRNGLVWTDETLDAFLAGPSDYVEGTRMIISSGPVRDPAARAAVINILKAETMPPSHRVTP